MEKKKTICLILDGLGISDKVEGNPVKAQGMPFLESLKKDYSYTSLFASEEYVGLSKGQMGNSEVGHLNLGAGRVVLQDLERINKDIQVGKFSKLEKLENMFEFVKEKNSRLHLLGLLSNGGVHSHIHHLFATIESAINFGIQKICVHIILDGRDTKIDSGKSFVNELIEKYGNRIQISTIVGRCYAMDREKRWDRIKVAYDLIVNGKGEKEFTSPLLAIKNEYDLKLFDEFMPALKNAEYFGVEENDCIFTFNYRSDRMREICHAFCDDDFKEFEVKKKPFSKVLTMTEYDASLKNLSVLYEPIKIEDNLSAVLSKNGINQFHVSETTKYAHVTFFFNGGIERPYKNEERVLIDSYNVKNFKVVPQMRAVEISQRIIEAIRSKKYEFILSNLSNLDMIGHTGDFDACKRAIQVVDDCVKNICEVAKEHNYAVVITADHGNVEKLLNEDGSVCTTHTTNKVPFFIYNFPKTKLMEDNGKLSNVSPTILKLMGIEIPDTMDEPLF